MERLPFRYVLVSTSLYWFGLAGILALVPFWTEAYLGCAKSDVAFLMLPFLVVNLIAFFAFNALVPRFGKYRLMLVTFLGTGFAMASLCLVGHVPFGTEFVQSAVLMGLLGVPVAGFMVLPFAVLADVVDDDERHTGRRREAIFFGVQGIGQKIMIGLSMLAFTAVPYVGGDAAAPQVTPFGLKLMAVLCGVACVMACLAFLRYPLRDASPSQARVSL